MRRLVVMMLVTAGVMTSGCALMDAGRNMSRTAWRTLRPKSADYQDPAEDFEVDEWSSVGSEGRGDTARERESDGLSKYIQSPKARAIERNLGFD